MDETAKVNSARFEIPAAIGDLIIELNGEVAKQEAMLNVHRTMLSKLVAANAVGSQAGFDLNRDFGFSVQKHPNGKTELILTAQG